MKYFLHFANRKQVIVNRDRYWTTASFQLDAGGLEQTGVEVWGAVEVTALIPSASADYCYVSDATIRQTLSCSLKAILLKG